MKLKRQVRVEFRERYVRGGKPTERSDEKVSKLVNKDEQAGCGKGWASDVMER